MKALQSKDATLQKAALVAIAEYREKAAPAVPLLIPLLTHADKWLAALAADDLRMIGPGAEAAIPALLVAIDGSDLQLAGFAAFALGTIGRADEDVLAALMRHVSDADFSMGMFVQKSLGLLTGKKFTKPEEWLDWWSKRPTPTP
jgi:HEAT repeat protein